MKYVSIGGQAVMEGVMMKSATSLVMSVRRSDGTIAIEKKKLEQKKWRKVVAKVPIVRGVVAFVESLVMGMKLTSQSAEMYGEDLLENEEPTKFEKWLSKTLNLKLETVAIVLGIILGLGLSFLLFMFLPAMASTLVCNIFNITKDSATVGLKLLLNIVEGVVKILIFFGYLLSIYRG